MLLVNVTTLKTYRLISVINMKKTLKKYIMSITNQTSREEKKSSQTGNLNSKRVSWNSKRKHNYRYITSVF